MQHQLEFSKSILDRESQLRIYSASATRDVAQVCCWDVNEDSSEQGLTRHDRLRLSNLTMKSTLSHRRNSSAMLLCLPVSAATTFTNFPELPSELRCLIWEMALPSSRIILLEHKRTKPNPQSLEGALRIDRLGFRADSIPPSVLFVCKEAHEEASRHYTRAFSNARGTSVPETYFDYKKDVLYLGPEYMGPYTLDPALYQARIHWVVGHELHKDDLSRVENLAIWYGNFMPGPHSVTEYLARILRYFENVKNVTIVSKKYCMPGFRDTYPKMHGELKFLKDIEVQDPYSDADVKIQGLTIPNSKCWISHSRFNLEMMQKIIEKPEDYSISSASFKIPDVSYNILTTSHGEELLLQEAREAEACKMWGFEQGDDCD